MYFLTLKDFVETNACRIFEDVNHQINNVFYYVIFFYFCFGKKRKEVTVL